MEYLDEIDCNTPWGLLTPITTSDDGVLGDGQCGAWANLMESVLAVQSISRVGHEATVSAPEAPGSQIRTFYEDSPHAMGDHGFLVKTWTFETMDTATVLKGLVPPGSNLAITLNGAASLKLKASEYPYIAVLATEGSLFTSDGKAYNFGFHDVKFSKSDPAAKGPNDKPASLFKLHVFCQYDLGSGPVWLDPSYGVTYTGASEEARLADFRKHLDGWWEYYGQAQVDTGSGVETRRVYLVRPGVTAADGLTVKVE